MNIKKLNPNVILGIVIGILAVIIVDLEATWLYYAIEDYGVNVNLARFDKLKEVVSIITFTGIVTIFTVKIKSINHNIILGNVIGMLISVFVAIQGSWLYWAIKEQGINLNPIKFQIAIIFTYIIIFITSIIVFNNKKIKKINLNKINIYLLLSIIVSLIIASAFVMFMLNKVVKQLYLNETLSLFKINLSINVLFIVGIATFVVIFLSLVNRKVKYIKLLTKEVKKIKQEGFGKVIEVRGKDELAELCESINSMSLELKEKIENERKLLNNRNELIVNVSHDLRTPLTSIMGYIDIIKKGEYKSEEQFSEYLNIIDQKSKNLNKLINELFEYTKLNNHDIKLNYSKVEIVSLVQQIVGEYVYIFEKDGLELVADIKDKDIYINIDLEKIVRVLDNLITNSRKYSVKGSSVILKLEEEAENVIIALSNKTEELKAEELDNIFERFYKGDKSRMEAESSGLGLSIVKRILELHNGSINADLKEGIITFIIRIPFK